jgi:Arc/MetJ-type ribon-helix-helix transcriptional regulator
VSKQVNIRLSEELLGNIDTLVRQGMYSDRAEFIREAIRIKLGSEPLKLVGVPAK